MSPFRVLDLSFSSPEENLACDEALLDEAEAGRDFSVLRFWESSRPFVVLGYANKAAEEADLEACERCGVPVCRRCSGGGSVLQGPGCLNYAVILSIDSHRELETISGANRFVMERHRAMLAQRTGQPISIAGHSDLIIGARKFSGNAQRRKRRALLFHGTFLLDFDLCLLEQLLRPPPRQPAYRAQRRHGEFLTRLPLTVPALKEALQKAWKADDTTVAVPRDAMAHLVADRYSQREWNLKW